MLNKVCVLTIKVDNMQAAVEFYTKTLNFAVSKEYGEKIVSLVHDEIPVVLEETEMNGIRGEQGVLLGIQSEDLDKDMEYLRLKGVKLLFNEPRPCPPGRYIVVEDPSGNQIELLEFSE